MNPRLRAWLARAPVWLALLVALYVVVHTTTWMVRLWNPVVWWDSWGFVDHMLDRSDGKYPIERLWEQHNEHRILFPRLVFFADYLGFQGRQLVEPVWMWVNQLVLALLLVRIVRGLLPQPVLPAFLALALAALFSAAQMENFLWAFQVQFLGVLLAAAAAFFALTRARESRGALVLAILAMVGASFTMSNGLLVWPIGVVLLCVFRVPKVRCFELLVTGLALIAFYLSGYQQPETHASPLASLGEPVAVAKYLFAYLGSPFGELGLGAAIPIGAGGLLLFLLLLLRAVQARQFLQPGAVVLLAVGAFALGTATLTALGRVTMELSSAMTSRYTSPALLFWVATLGSTAASLARPGRNRVLLASGLLVAATLLLGWRQKPYVHRLFGMHQRIELASLALLVTPQDRELMSAGHPQPETLTPLIEFLREQRWSSFADEWHLLPGMALKDRFETVPAPIPGGMFSAERRGDHGQYVLLRGWAVAPEDPRSAQQFVWTDLQGRIVGLGRGGYGYPLLLGRTLPPGAERAAEWMALVHAPEPGALSLRGYVVDGTRGAARLLGGTFTVAPYENVAAEQIGAPLLAELPVTPVGFVPRVAPAVAPPPQTSWTWYGSYVEADADVGQIIFGPFVPPARDFTIPFLTGPSTNGLRLRVLDARSGAVLATAGSLAPSTLAWRGWVVRLPDDHEGPIRVIAEDAGVHWGQWIAVGPPCAHLARRPDGG